MEELHVYAPYKFLLVTVKEWLKSVLNYRSYPKNKTGYPFLDHPVAQVYLRLNIECCHGTVLRRIGLLFMFLIASTPGKNTTASSLNPFSASDQASGNYFSTIQQASQGQNQVSSRNMIR